MMQKQPKKVAPVNKRNADVKQVMYGKVPPQAVDIEQAVLGAIMLEKQAIYTVSEWLKPYHFYQEKHTHIMQAAINVQASHGAVDVLTVSQALKAMGKFEEVGGDYYVHTLTNYVVSSSHVSQHARIILQKYIQRELIKIGGQIISDAYVDMADVFDLIDQAETSLFTLAAGMQKRPYYDTSALSVQAWQQLEMMRQNPDKITGVTSGFRGIDAVTHGWQKTDLIILAARPAVGKTALALNLARNAANKGTAVAFFSLEMSAGQLFYRLLSAESDTPLELIQRGRIDEMGMKTVYVKGIQPLANVPLYIDDTPALSLMELRAKARRLVASGVGLIIVDYLQLMSADSNIGNREQVISTISRGLKQLAKELNVPIIALSQLSRAVETRGGEKIPQLSDLRESGAIEQDADSVIFVYRPEYYGLNKNAEGESTKGETHLRWAKHRAGRLETVKLRAELSYQKFYEMDFMHTKSENDNGLSKQGASQLTLGQNEDLPF